VAGIIERGIVSAQTPAPDPEALEDERLTGDANEAGYRWAERRGLTITADCPAFPRRSATGARVM